MSEAGTQFSAGASDRRVERGQSLFLGGLLLAFLTCSIPALALPDGWRSLANFRRGDVNQDGTLNIADPIYLLTFNFLGGTTPSCLDAADVDDDGRVLGQVTDSVFLLNGLFLGGPMPPTPGPHDCGGDPTPDDLRCTTSGCERTEIDLTYSSLFGPVPQDEEADDPELESRNAADSRLDEPRTAVMDYLESRVREETRDSEKLLLLETYEPDSRDHGFFYLRLHPDGDHLDVATNIGTDGVWRTGVPQAGRTISGRGSFHEVTLRLSELPAAREILERIEAADARPGFDADPEDTQPLGGTTFFLTYKVGDSYMLQALYGVPYSYFGLYEGEELPREEPNASRYLQTGLVLDLWAAILTDGQVVDHRRPIPSEEGDGAAAAIQPGITVKGDDVFKDRVVQLFRTLVAVQNDDGTTTHCLRISRQGCRLVMRKLEPLEDFCDCYCKKPLAIALVYDAYRRNRIEIQEKRRGSDFVPLGGGTERSGRIRLDLAQRVLIIDPANPNRQTVLSEENIISHELIHAENHRQNRRSRRKIRVRCNNGRTRRLKVEEIHAVRGNNQIRREAGAGDGQMRREYDGCPVPDPTGSYLRVQNRYHGCTCAPNTR